ncbi:MAG: hypothetical protein AAGA81_15395 [Acidobacteriota bacterium]
MNERGRSDGGFTVVELLISAALLLLGIFLATQILLESQRLFLRTQRTLVAEETDFATQRLRTDLRTADFPSLPLLAVDGRWMTTTLTLRRGTGSIVWSLEDGSLVRRELDAAGDVSTERTLLQRLDSWRWRALTSSLVEVETGVLRESSPTGSALLLERERRNTRLETTTVRAYFRGRSGRRRW